MTLLDCCQPAIRHRALLTPQETQWKLMDMLLFLHLDHLLSFRPITLHTSHQHELKANMTLTGKSDRYSRLASE